MTGPEPADSVALRDFMAILAREVRLIALAGKVIEDRVGDRIAEGTTRADAFLPSLQGLDHLVQTANELSHFLDDVALETDGHLRVPVAAPARRVKLRALAEALVRVSREAPPTFDDTMLGHVDLF
ncbi:MAG: hypothetical protein EON48_01940 [Acetobacteraceae bacterium]|nr:MAG: hypothetical protein EON48_01940 [Acetobacteraceae bacterium]